MNLRAGSLGLGLLAAATIGAADPGAPLESSKQELRILQSDQTAKNSATAAGKLTEGLPQLNSPVPGAIPLEMPTSEKTEKELKKKKEAQKNWLLDGVDRLGPNPKTKGKETDEPAQAFSEEEREDKEVDSSDPNYMLKIYSEQKKAGEAKAAARQSGANRNDAFAPFLQGWLSTSPDHGKFFGDFVGKPDASVGPVTALNPAEGGLSQSVVTSVDIAGATRAGPAAAQPNPYLEGLEAVPLQDLGPKLNQPVPGTNSFGNPAGAPPPATLAGPLSAERPADKKAPFVPPADDKKYFPQLNKF